MKLNYGKRIFDVCKKLINLNRSLTGEGNRQTLRILSKINKNLKIKKFKSGEKIFDWKIPLEWNIKNVYRDLATRQEAKERIFAWLYNPASKDYLSNRAYERDKVLEKYWDGKEVKTIFNKVIPSDRHHALNYIIQSTTAEMFLKQMVKVHEILKEKKSFIAFSVHDSLVIDLAKEDKELIPELIRVFEETPIGNFKANLSLGKSYGKMRKV